MIELAALREYRVLIRANTARSSRCYPAAAQAGFTLIEIMVVLVVIAILMGTVSVGFNSNQEFRSARDYAQRLAMRMELARDRAIQNNQEWGLFIAEDSYEFSYYDDVEGRWIKHGSRPFNLERTKLPLVYDVTVEELAGQLNSDDSVPDLVFFSSGETSRFELNLRIDGMNQRSWSLSSDGFSNVETNEKRN